MTSTFAIVGGASGAGKTTLINSLPPHRRFNTGDYFKSAMSLEDRDQVRSLRWTDFEQVVADKLANDMTLDLEIGQITILDTHFAAKVGGTQYRIGLSRALIFKIFRIIMAAHRSAAVGPLQWRVILVDISPELLLARRRSDHSRRRELDAADCVRALERNRVCSTQYLYECARAAKAEGANAYLPAYGLVENSDLGIARSSFTNFILGR